MKRNHIHMATGLLGEAISGMRRNCEIVIYIDAAAAMKDNIQFLLSENGVVLSLGLNGVLDKKYFSHVLKVPEMTPFDPDFPNTLNK